MSVGITVWPPEQYEFVTESNKIEGIIRPPTQAELEATFKFLALTEVRVADLEHFVKVCAGARLRLSTGMDVRVGGHIPPPGGPGIGSALDDLIRRANEADADPFRIHVEYETLHPFRDGNGRSGRVLWAWMMLRLGATAWLKRGFLHEWYYQSLSASRKS